ncbi:MAG: Predicted hydroxymethylpyrimidine transporter CytX, partial [uncultured Corynebacteriales bacterium]
DGDIRPHVRGPGHPDRGPAADAGVHRPARPVGEPGDQPAHPGHRDLPGGAGAVVRRHRGRDRRRHRDRLRAARPGRPGRRGHRRADDGAAARPARPLRVVRADGAQPAAVRGLGDVRDLDHLLRRPRGLGRPAALGVRADRRGDRDPDGAAAAGVGAAAQADRRRRGGGLLGVLHDRDAPPAAGRPHRGRLHRLLDVDGPGHRAAGVLDPVGRRLLPVQPVAAGRRPRHRAGVRRLQRGVLPARSAGAARVRRGRPGRHRGAAGRPGRGARAGHPGHRRGGRGVRQHLLDRDVRAEPGPEGRPAGAGGARRRGGDAARAGRRRRRVRAVPVPDRVGVRSAGRDAGGGLRAVPRPVRHLGRRAGPVGDAGAVGGRVRRLPADRADDPGRLGVLGGLLAGRAGPARRLPDQRLLRLPGRPGRRRPPHPGRPEGRYCPVV